MCGIKEAGFLVIGAADSLRRMSLFFTLTETLFRRERRFKKTQNHHRWEVTFAELMAYAKSEAAYAKTQIRYLTRYIERLGILRTAPGTQLRSLSRLWLLLFRRGMV